MKIHTIVIDDEVTLNFKLPTNCLGCPMFVTGNTDAKCTVTGAMMVKLDMAHRHGKCPFDKAVKR